MNKKLAADDSETETVNIIDMQCVGATDNTKRYPPTHIKWSILNLACSILCLFGLFFSMAAFNYSFKTQDDIENGNLKKAKRNSKLARKFNMIVSTLSLIGLLIFVLFITVRSNSIFRTHNHRPQTHATSQLHLQQSSSSNNLTQSKSFVKEPIITELIVGHWKMISSVNFQNYLTDIEVNFFIKNLADMFYPNVEFQFNENENEWKIIGSTSVKIVTSIFKFGIEFEEEMFGQSCKSTYLLVNDKFSKTQRYMNGTLFSWITFEMDSNGQLLNIFNSKNARAVRTFKRVEFNEYD